MTDLHPYNVTDRSSLPSRVADLQCIVLELLDRVQKLEGTTQKEKS